MNGSEGYFDFSRYRSNSLPAGTQPPVGLTVARVKCILKKMEFQFSFFKVSFLLSKSQHSTCKFIWIFNLIERWAIMVVKSILSQVCWWRRMGEGDDDEDSF